MGGRTFECLEAVINRYKVEQIVEGHTLSQPVKVSRRLGRRSSVARLCSERVLVL